MSMLASLPRTTFAACFLSAIGISQAITAVATAGTLLQVSCTGGPTNFLSPGTVISGGTMLTTQGTTPNGTVQATTTVAPLAIGEHAVEAVLATDVHAVASVAFSNLAAECGQFWVAPLLGRNDVLVRFLAGEPVRGRFVIAYTRQVFRLCTMTYWVDVGDDGVVEASNLLSTQQLLPVAFGPGTFDVRISSFAGLHLADEFGIDGGTAQLVVRFVPDSRCVATQTAPPCGGLVLEPTQNFTLGTDQVVTGLQTSGQSLAALVYGFQPSTTPLPLSAGCLLTNDAFAVRLLLPDATGRAVHSLHTVPAAMRPFAIHAEAVELDLARNTVTTSASYRIDCQ